MSEDEKEKNNLLVNIEQRKNQLQNTIFYINHACGRDAQGNFNPRVFKKVSWDDLQYIRFVYKDNSKNSEVSESARRYINEAIRLMRNEICDKAIELARYEYEREVLEQKENAQKILLEIKKLEDNNEEQNPEL